VKNVILCPSTLAEDSERKSNCHSERSEESLKRRDKPASCSE
jgi:hypothetical protein